MADARFYYWGTFFKEHNRNVPYKSKRPPTLGAHEFHDLTVIPALVISHQQPLELRHMAFGNDDQALPLGDHVVVGEDHRCPLVTVVEHLSFHTVQAQPDGGVHRVDAIRKDGFDGQGRDIAGAADDHRHTPDTSAVGIESLIDQLSDVAEDVVIRRIAQNVLIQNEFPGVLQI